MADGLEVSLRRTSSLRTLELKAFVMESHLALAGRWPAVTFQGLEPALGVSITHLGYDRVRLLVNVALGLAPRLREPFDVPFQVLLEVDRHDSSVSWRSWNKSYCRSPSADWRDAFGTATRFGEFRIGRRPRPTR